MTDCCNVFDQPVKNETRIYNNIKKFFTGPGDDYIITHYMITCCLLDYAYFKKNYNLIAIDLSKQQALVADTKAIRQINFTGNLERVRNTTVFFIIEEVKT